LPPAGFEIDPLPRDVGCFFVLLVDLREARSLAVGFGDRLFAIGFGILSDLGGAAARFRHDAVGALGFYLDTTREG
jgi:hypothetical protein